MTLRLKWAAPLLSRVILGLVPMLLFPIRLNHQLSKPILFLTLPAPLLSTPLPLAERLPAITKISPDSAMSASVPLLRSPVLRSRAPPRQAISSPWVPSKSAQAERRLPFRITGSVHPPPLIQTTSPPTMICLCQATLRAGAPFLSPERLPCQTLSGFPREVFPAMWG